MASCGLGIIFVAMVGLSVWRTGRKKREKGARTGELVGSPAA
jgi:hypothetical protein